MPLLSSVGARNPEFSRRRIQSSASYLSLSQIHLQSSVLYYAKANILPYSKSFLIVWAAHRDKAAMVRVGFPVATVGNTPLPTRNRLGWSHDRCSELTTEFPLVVPIQ